MIDNNLVIYIHWPFCLSLCPYCDFNSHIASTIDHSSWLRAYKCELDQNKELLKDENISSIFFGGGTPSLMDPVIIRGIIDHIGSIAQLDKNIEITLEANPTSSEYNKFKSFREAGINRISVGIQSFIDADLKALGRKHSATEAIEAVKMAKSVFDRYSFDIIYTRENQTLDSWKDELSRIMELASGHISLYQLTIEKATPFYSMQQRGELILPENEIAADMYQHSLDYLRSLGYKRYEISNFAKEGNECKHNLAYWNYNNYLGIGPGAHSRISFDGKEITAIMNYHKPDKWMNLLEENKSPVQTKTILNNNELIEEIVMMNLRLEEGMTSNKLEKYLSLNFEDILNKEELDKFIDAGFVEYDKYNLTLTDKGMMMHSYIVLRLIN